MFTSCDLSEIKFCILYCIYCIQRISIFIKKEGAMEGRTLYNRILPCLFKHMRVFIANTHWNTCQFTINSLKEYRMINRLIGMGHSEYKRTRFSKMIIEIFDQHHSPSITCVNKAIIWLCITRLNTMPKGTMSCS